ncbi:hypothetical protein Cgig2_028611 [Carnegiea gigantea]|uniref:Aminotransferase-like plant mobile domain-containing protein n=1 Tax=Carnegiea gigantea TaxID=171969 RepID=A0A9Q1K7A8_9CARY|nr:hypothetical protein Cgig2_028611 [Carnegiea gigantea]
MKGIHSKMVENATMDLIFNSQAPCKVSSGRLESSKGHFVRYRRNDENKFLTGGRDWGLTFQFGGCLTFVMGVMKWIKQAGIFCAIGVSQFLYHFDANVWRTFCELWGPLTNTFHHGIGEVDISLHDLEWIRGLPTLTATYEESLPLNKDLTDHSKYPAAVVELLRIHAELCEFHKRIRGLFTYGEQTDSEKEKFVAKKRNPICISYQERIANKSVITEGELAPFLAFG